MPKLSQECIDTARAAMNLFNEDEMRDYAIRVFQRIREMKDVSGVAAVKEAVSEINNEKLQQLFESAAIKANNAAKFEENSSAMKNKKASVRNILGRGYKYLANNVESAQRAAQNKLYDIFKKVTKDELVYMQKKESNLDIVRAMDGKESSSIGRSIGKKIIEYIEKFRNPDMVSSNALSLYHVQGDRYFRASHDVSRLLTGGRGLIAAAKSGEKYTTTQAKKIWIEDIKKEINIERTFADSDAIGVDGEINHGEVKKVLGEIYDNITQGHSDIFPKGGRGRRFFVWKDMESWYNYNEKYGRGDILSALRNDIHASGNKIGAARILGENPASMYKELFDLQKEIDPKGALWRRHTDLIFKKAMGIDQSIVSPTLANIGGTGRTLSAMARLVPIAALSVADLAHVVAFATRWGYSPFKAIGETLGGLFNAIPNEKRAYIAKVFKMNTDSHLAYIGKFTEANNTNQLLSKVSTWFYRGIAMVSYDNGNKISGMTMMAKNLADNSRFKFNGIHEDLRKQLNKFEITEKEWDFLRKKNQFGLFTTDNVEKLTEQELRELYADTKGLRPYYEMRNDLYRKVYSMFDVASENAVMTPGLFSRSFMSQGLQPGTPMGELLATFMQMKGFALNYIDRVLIQGFHDADSAKAKFGWALQLMAMSLPLSYMSNYFYYLSNGKSMPDPSEMSWAQKVDYALKLIAPGLGIFSMVADPMKQNQSLVMSMLSSPSLKLISDVLALPFELVGGDPDKLKKSAGRIAEYSTPLGSIPFLSPYMRQIFEQQSYLQPGQEQLFGA